MGPFICRTRTMLEKEAEMVLSQALRPGDTTHSTDLSSKAIKIAMPYFMITNFILVLLSYY